MYVYVGRRKGCREVREDKMLRSYERKHSNDGREERTGSRGKGKDLERVEKERVWRKSMKKKSTKWMISDMERVW